MIEVQPAMAEISFVCDHYDEAHTFCRRCLECGDVDTLQDALAWYEQHLCKIEACPICGNDADRRIDRSYTGAGNPPWDVCETPCKEAWIKTRWATTGGRPDLNGTWRG